MLATTPVAHLLIYALDRRLSGSFVLEEANRRKHAVYFADGAPAIARLATPVARLGELAVERGVLEGGRLDEAVARARETNSRLGRVLVEWGVLDESGVEALLGEQVARRVVELGLLPPDTRYGYYDGTNFLERAGGPKVPAQPLPLVWRVLKQSQDTTRINEMLARFQGIALRFHVDAPLLGFGFDGPEQSVVDVLAARPQPFSELAARQLLEPERLQKLVYLFVALRYFDTGGAARPVGAVVRTSALPPILPSSPPVAATSAAPQAPQSPDPPPADDEFRKELRARAEASRDSYYDVLGVPRDAPESAIAGAYFQLAKRWHPDRLGPAYSDVREVATKVFARMSEAHQVLSDPARRKEYDELEKAGQGAAEDQEQVQKIVRAAMNFQKAQVLLKRNNLPAAEEAARAALADAPDQADHLALVAWLEATKPNADLEARLRELDKAVSMEPANTRVRWFRGQILKRLGKERKALEDFRLIVEQDPRHVDAQREIRLHDMKRPGARTSHPPSDRGGEAGRASVPPGEKGGIFGRLFKR
jgi:curved DNA-binding protein CbpA